MEVMSVDWTTKYDFIPQIQQTMKELNKKEIQIGVFGEEAWISSMYEYGCILKPKKGYLTIPCNPKAKGKKPKDFENLMTLETKSGEKVLAISKGKNNYEVMFYLVSEIVIPETAFLRKGYDSNINKALNQQESKRRLLVDGKFQVEAYLEQLGQMLADRIKNNTKKLLRSSNTKGHTNSKNDLNPLKDTEKIIQNIIYKVE